MAVAINNITPNSIIIYMPTNRTLLKIAIPNMLAAIVMPAAQLIDLAFLGQINDITQLSGVILSTVIFDYIFWSFGFLRMGTTGPVAQALGAGHATEAANIFWRSMLLAISFATIIIILQKPIANIGFQLLAGDTASKKAGYAYYHAVIWSTLPVLVNYAAIGWLLGYKKAGAVLLINASIAICNIVLDYWFIVVNNMGASGAGYALMLATWLGAFVSIFMVWTVNKSIPVFNCNEILNWRKAKLMLSLNMAITLRSFLLISVLAIFTNISASFNATLLAANAILMRLWIISAYIIDGFAIALESFAGNFHGSGNKIALQHIFKLAMRWNFITTTVFIAIYGTFTQPILSLLNNTQSVVETALDYKIWMLATIILGGVAFIYDGLFLGLAKAKLLLHSMFIAATIFTLFAIIALKYQSPDILWIAMIAFIAARAATLWWHSRKYLRLHH